MSTVTTPETPGAAIPSTAHAEHTTSPAHAHRADRASQALEARYGTPWSAPLPAWNATLDSLLAHRSVRNYADKPLPAGTLETLIAAAQSA